MFGSGNCSIAIQMDSELTLPVMWEVFGAKLFWYLVLCQPMVSVYSDSKDPVIDLGSMFTHTPHLPPNIRPWQCLWMNVNSIIMALAKVKYFNSTCLSCCQLRGITVLVKSWLLSQFLWMIYSSPMVCAMWRKSGEKIMSRLSHN